MSAAGAYWACALTEARRERTAVRFLTLSGYETYLPMTGSRRRVVPLFPGYVFCWITTDQGWWTARWTIGVRAVVRVGGDTPARVPDRIIAELRSRERHGLIQLPVKPGLRRGDQVRITAGPFEHRLAIYDGMKSSDRVAVLLAMLGSVQRVELPKRDITPA